MCDVGGACPFIPELPLWCIAHVQSHARSPSCSQGLLTSYGACSTKTKALERSIHRWSWLVIWNAIQYNNRSHGVLAKIIVTPWGQKFTVLAKMIVTSWGPRQNDCDVMGASLHAGVPSGDALFASLERLHAGYMGADVSSPCQSNVEFPLTVC